ncbi:hypothetical protein CASFOL_031729 [Castilleja foliolosa]|uniref:Uncharacterized protein n=1 Tax=Castilleja foliolosa TaxID=1961234 RepID=A0ABD3C7G1_9LAMI
MAGKIRKIEWLLEDEELKMIRYKLVCRDWRDLIESPNFVSAHLNHSKHNLSRHHILFHEKNKELNTMEDWVLEIQFVNVEYYSLRFTKIVHFAIFNSKVDNLCETEDGPVPSLLKKDNKRERTWDDGDLDDNDVKDSWEEEDKPAPAPKAEPMPIEKAPKKTVARTVEKKGRSVEDVKEAPLDPIEEKLCQQRLVEEADYKSTEELFGKTGDGNTLGNFIPQYESDLRSMQN